MIQVDAYLHVCKLHIFDYISTENFFNLKIPKINYKVSPTLDGHCLCHDDSTINIVLHYYCKYYDVNSLAYAYKVFVILTNMLLMEKPLKGCSHHN